MTTTIQTKEIINSLLSTGLNRNDFSVKANRRRVRGEDGKKHTEFLPGEQIHFHCSEADYRKFYSQIQEAGFELIFTYQPNATGDKVSTLQPEVHPTRTGNPGGIYYYILTDNQEEEELYSASKQYDITAYDFNGAPITTVHTSLIMAGNLITAELTKNLSRTPYYRSWLQGNCQIRIKVTD